jgi:hypothetical protein
MATKTFEVVSYQVYLARNMSIGGGALAHFHAYIICEGAKGERFTVYFLTPESEPADNFYRSKEEWATSFLPAAQYPWYIDLLRNEKPVFAYLSEERPDWNRLFTGSEPVGEGERGLPAPKIAPPKKKARYTRK